MHKKSQQHQISHINKILIGQKQVMQQMRLFADEDQDDSLDLPPQFAKINHKYLHKIENAESLIKNAQRINMSQLKTARTSDKSKKINSETPQQYELNHFEKHKNDPHAQINGTIPSNFDSKTSIKEISQIQPRRFLKESTTFKQLSNQKSEQIDLKQSHQGSVKTSLVKISSSLVENYFRQKIKVIDNQISPADIYKLFDPFYELCGIKLGVPLIKKYKNCIYFGQSPKIAESKYEGFLLFHLQMKIYYGQLKSERKNGKGIELDFKNSISYEGNFQNGKKNGTFIVTTPSEVYKGQLYHGLYHGQGQLSNQFSVYKGQFQKGQRNGQGEEYFIKSNLTISGLFVNNRFENSHRLQPQPRQSKSTSKHQNWFANENPERSANPNLNYQEYNYEFGTLTDQEQEGECEIVPLKRNLFRIKQAKSPKRKQTPSQERPLRQSRVPK